MHLTERQFNEYANRRLSPSELLFVDDHIIACTDCCKKLSSVLQANSGGFGAVNFLRGELTATEEDFHLKFTDLTACLDPQLGVTARQTMGDHLELCSSCRAEFEDLQAFEKTLAQPSVPKKIAPPNWWESVKIGWWVWPAATLLGLMLIAIGFYGRRLGSPPASSPSVMAAKSIATPVTSDATPSAPTPFPPENLSSAQLSEEYAVQKALASGRIEIPAAVKNLWINGGGGRAGTAAENAFAVVAPQGILVESEQPRLQWSSLPTAKQYVVKISDQNFKEVAHSQALTTLSWASPVKLKRGELYQWRVVATTVDGKQLSAPVPSAPEATFKVLSSEGVGIVHRARQRYAAASVELGVIYAQVGLLTQAEQELQLASRQSSIAQHLLTYLRQEFK